MGGQPGEWRNGRSVGGSYRLQTTEARTSAGLRSERSGTATVVTSNLPIRLWHHQLLPGGQAEISRGPSHLLCLLPFALWLLCVRRISPLLPMVMTHAKQNASTSGFALPTVFRLLSFASADDSPQLLDDILQHFIDVLEHSWNPWKSSGHRNHCLHAPGTWTSVT